MDKISGSLRWPDDIQERLHTEGRHENGQLQAVGIGLPVGRAAAVGHDEPYRLQAMGRSAAGSPPGGCLQGARRTHGHAHDVPQGLPATPSRAQSGTEAEGQRPGSAAVPGRLSMLLGYCHWHCCRWLGEQGTSDYRDSYQRWSIAQRPHVGPDVHYHPPTVPFEGMSTHNAHFIEHPLDPRKSCKPDARAYTNGGDFDDGTIYRMEYTPKLVEPCPAALLESSRARFIYREQVRDVNV